MTAKHFEIVAAKNCKNYASLCISISKSEFPRTFQNKDLTTKQEFGASGKSFRESGSISIPLSTDATWLVVVGSALTSDFGLGGEDGVEPGRTRGGISGTEKEARRAIPLISTFSVAMNLSSMARV